MHTSLGPALAAYRLAEHAQTLTDATVKPGAFPDVAAVCAVAEGLHLTAGLLSTAVEQSSAALRALEERGLATADGGEAGDVVSGALRALLNARVGLVGVREELRAVEAAVGRLKGVRFGGGRE
ncbi:hypothetical protein [Streptomyces sp. NPDC048611]|uniref:hypothetical protein n=1 Tax=Streptomyces sp. NPDC048611 TaxID=3155635 RepID=UPI003421DD84